MATDSPIRFGSGVYTGVAPRRFASTRGVMSCSVSSPAKKRSSSSTMKLKKRGSTGGAEARDMRRQENVRQAANLTVFRDRLRVEHIQTHADVALLGPRDERVRVDDTTA